MSRHFAIIEAVELSDKMAALHTQGLQVLSDTLIKYFAGRLALRAKFAGVGQIILMQLFDSFGELFNTAVHAIHLLKIGFDLVVCLQDLGWLNLVFASDLIDIA